MNIKGLKRRGNAVISSDINFINWLRSQLLGMVDPETQSSQNGSGFYELSMLSQKPEYSDKKCTIFFAFLIFSPRLGVTKDHYMTPP
jgi:hypothetical protein